MFTDIAVAATLGVQAPASVQADSQAGDRIEIIVTGERVPRRVRETASSVVVVGQREIEAGTADRVDQVLAMVPNVLLGNGSEGPAIRGQDTTGALQALPAFLGGNRPRTSLIVDGRRATYNEFVFGTAPMWDVNRVEVFRSPQTTTQGQNSIAGGIFVYSNDPTFEPEHRARLIGGNYRTRELSALVSAPLSADVALRISGDLRYARTTSRIADRIAHGDPNHDVFGLVRAKLLVKPRGSAGTRLLLTLTHSQSQMPQIVGLTEPFRKRRDKDGFYGTFRIRTNTLTAMAHQPLTPNLSADVILTAGASNARRLAFPGLGQSHNRGRDWSAEAVFNWSPEGPLRAVGGLSATHLVLRQFIDLSLLGGLGRFHDTQDSEGVFGEATLALFSGAALTAGIRYQQDRQNRTGAFDNGLSQVSLNYDRTFQAWLPKLSLAYDFSPVVRAGILVQRAYNPGGTTLRFDTGRPDDFDAESLWDYEAFARARLARGITVSANLFYYDIRSAQRAQRLVITSPSGQGVGFADLFNAHEAHSYGAEAQLDWRHDPQLSGRLAIGLLRTKLVDAGPDYSDFTGKQFSRSPPLTASAAIDWRATPALRLSAQARYHSAYFSNDVNSADVRVLPAAIFDVRGEYQLGHYSLFAYARNLFDKFALIERFLPDEATSEDPRMVGAGIEVRF